MDRLKLALASGVRLGSNNPTNFRGGDIAQFRKFAGRPLSPEIPSLQPRNETNDFHPLLALLEQGAPGTAGQLQRQLKQLMDEAMEDVAAETNNEAGAIEDLGSEAPLAEIPLAEFPQMTILDSQPIGGSLNFTPGILEGGVHFLGELPHPAHPPDHLPHHPPPPPATVRQVELPSPAPGCRTISTTTCHHHPVVVPRKVAYEKCRQVPGVDCYFVLKTVPDLQCSPESYEDCEDIVKQVLHILLHCAS